MAAYVIQWRQVLHPFAAIWSKNSPWHWLHLLPQVLAHLFKRIFNDSMYNILYYKCFNLNWFFASSFHSWCSFRHKIATNNFLPSPLVSLMTSHCKSVSRELIITSAPIVFANWRRSELMSATRILDAPKALAQAAANRPIAPAPMISTSFPSGLIRLTPLNATPETLYLKCFFGWFLW